MRNDRVEEALVADRKTVDSLEDLDEGTEGGTATTRRGLRASGGFRFSSGGTMVGAIGARGFSGRSKNILATGKRASSIHFQAVSESKLSLLSARTALGCDLRGGRRVDVFMVSG